MADIRNHNGSGLDGLNEFEDVVILRPDGSVDVYGGYTTVIDQRTAEPDDDTACLVQTAHDAVVLLLEYAPDMAAQDLSRRQIGLALSGRLTVRRDDDTDCLIQTAHEAVTLLMAYTPDTTTQKLSQRQIDLALSAR